MVVSAPRVDQQAPRHDQILGALPRPGWLKSGSLLDHQWVVAFDDAALKRRSDCRVHFDVVVAPHGVRSSDPSLEHDLLTAKLLVYNALKPGYAGGITTSITYAPLLAREYFAFVRWRLSRGIVRNADLSFDWMEAFFDQLRAHGPTSLLPLKARAEELIERYKNNRIAFPLQKSWSRGNVALRPIAHELGLDHPRAIPPEVRSILLQAAEEQGCSAQDDRDQGRSGRSGMRVTRSKAEDAWSASRLLILLRPLELLHRYANHMTHDPIGFDPFGGFRSVWQAAEALATRAPGRTPTIPPLQACHLINEALTWVLVHAGDILELNSQIEQRLHDVKPPSVRHKRVNAVMRNFRPMRAAGSGPWALPRNSLSARRLIVDLLPGACIVVIAAFAARRHEEIDALRLGAVEQNGEDYWLETWISKTVRDITKIPIPPSVARAIEVLQLLGASQRAERGTQWLLDFGFYGMARRKSASITSALEAFSDLAKVPDLPDGTKWWFAPHQFRRFFGITYYHHFRYPNLAALSQFYRHFDPDMTRTYITEAAQGSLLRIQEDKWVADEASRQAKLRDAERLADFKAEAKNFRIDRYRRIMSGEESASGFGGEKLTQELASLERQVISAIEIGRPGDAPATLDKLLEAYADGTRLEPNQLGHSYCRCRPTNPDLMAANCLQQEDGGRSATDFLSAPDPRHAADYVCSPCPHNVQLPENEAYWRELAAHEAKQARCPIGSLLAALAESRAEMANKHIERCFK